MKKYPLIFALILLLGSSLCMPAYAKDGTSKVYQIELIIFSRLRSKTLDSEQWPLIDPSAIKRSQAILLAPTPDTSDYYKRLATQDFVLKREQARFDKKHDYYPTLLHIAWRQPVDGPRDAKAVRIYGGKHYSNGGSTLERSTDESQPYDSQAHWQVNGTMTVSVRRYFDVRLDLLFAAPTKQLVHLSNTDYFDYTNSRLVYFRLLQNRRMRSNELNYIDFPLYGVLIKITPVEDTQALAA